MDNPVDLAGQKVLKEKDRKFATTLARGLSVLRAFRASDRLLGNQDISGRTKLPKSTVSRLTYTLSNLGYLNHIKDVEKYRLGPAVLALGNIAQASLSFLQTANPMMQELADTTATLVQMFVRDGNKMLITQCWRPRGFSSLWLEVGNRIPLINTASGTTYLASISDSELAAIAAELHDEGLVSPDELRAQVLKARADLLTRGYISAIGTWNKIINAVGVPFRDSEFGDSFVFICGAEADMLSKERIESAVGPLLKQRVQSLEHAMGYAPQYLPSIF